MQNYEPKSGKIINYKFGNVKAINKKEMHKEFYDWFDSEPPAKDIRQLKFPNNNEKKCVKEFLNKNILKNKEVATNIIKSSAYLPLSEKAVYGLSYVNYEVYPKSFVVYQ